MSNYSARKILLTSHPEYGARNGTDSTLYTWSITLGPPGTAAFYGSGPVDWKAVEAGLLSGMFEGLTSVEV